VSRSSLLIILWILIAGFGLAWIGSQKILAIYEYSRQKTESRELDEATQDLEIEREQLLMELLRESSDAEVRPLSDWSNIDWTRGADEAEIPNFSIEATRSSIEEPQKW